jgi:hypothetical protein
MKSWITNLILKGMFGSKKFIYGLIAVLTSVFSESFGLNPEQVNNVLVALATLILGTGLADFGKEAKKKE